MAIQHKPYTLEDFAGHIALPENEGRLFELINGEIIEVSPGRTSNSEIGHIIAFVVRTFCQANNIPCHTSGGDGAYQIGTSVAAPDFAYKPTLMSKDYPDPVVPLWAVEIVSPTDKGADVGKKRAIYLQAKLLYWEVYPDDKTVHVFVPDKPPQVLGIEDTLDGGDVLPGFTVAVRTLLVD